MKMRLRGGTNMDKKFWITIGILVVLVVGFVFFNVIGFIINPIVPTDTKILNILEENEDYLLGINGVIEAGIARNESNNYIIGIAVYVEDNMTNVQEIPSELDGFKVFIKRISETSEFEKEKMFIHKYYVPISISGLEEDDEATITIIGAEGSSFTCPGCKYNGDYLIGAYIPPNESGAYTVYASAQGYTVTPEKMAVQGVSSSFSGSPPFQEFVFQKQA